MSSYGEGIPLPLRTDVRKSTIDRCPEIEGTGAERREVLYALELLSARSPEHYQTVVDYIGVIECREAASGMAPYQTSPRYYVGYETRKAGPLWLASTIVHDAVHSKLYIDYRKANPQSNVPDDVWTGEQAEVECLQVQQLAIRQLGASYAQLNHLDTVITSNYYTIPESERGW